MLPIKNLTCGVGLLFVCSAYAHDSQHYTLKATSPLSAVAKVCKVKVVDIAKANGLKSDAVVPKGTRLVVPMAVTAAKPSGLAKLVHAASTSKLALHTAQRATSKPISAHMLFASASSPALKTTATTFSGKLSRKSYVVQKGDNNWIIAHNVGIKLSELSAVNPTIDIEKIHAGQVIFVPARALVASHTVKAKHTKMPRYALIRKDRVTIRQGPNSKSERVAVVDAGLHAAVLDRQNGWFKLRFPKGSIGWIRNDLIAATNTSGIVEHHRSSMVATRRSRHGRHYRNTGSISAPDGGGSDVVATASTYLGIPYSYGSASRSSTDCSGLVKQVYARKGVNLPRTSREMSGVGQKVSMNDLKPGDMVFFHTRNSRHVNHVGIYAGNGKFIHASSGGGRVQVNSLKDGYYANRISTVRRVSTPSKKK